MAKEGTIDPPQYFVASRSKLCRYPINFPDIVLPMITNFNVSCFLGGRVHAVAITADIDEGVVFFSDLGMKAIGMATLRDGAPVKIITGGVRSVQGLAVDWLTKHLYWTDHARGTIEVSRYDGSYRTTLIKDNVIKPRSIAIDPERKYMFWSEFGPPTQIERASLDGTERVVIMSAPYGVPFFIPTGLAVDTKEERLYYTDLSTRAINKADYFGNNKRQLLRKNGAIFFDVALYKDYILWTELGRNNGIYAANRHSGQIELEYHNRGEQVYGITSYADTRQKVMHHPCRFQNGGCDQLCLSSTSSHIGFVCNCTLGFYLADNGKACVSDLVQDDFFLVTDTYRRSIFQVSIESNLEPKALYLPSIQNPIAVSFDPIDRKVYWSDVGSKTLSRASLDGNDYQVIARDAIDHPDGIAVDSISRLLYWTDFGTHGLSVSHLDGSYRKTLIHGLDKPRSIVLHPVRGTMFWTDWGDNPVIERAFMDGTDRSTIISGSLGWPNGLTIDYIGNRLYWCDARLERFETADFYGNGRRLLYTFGRDVHAYEVAVFGQFLYWTDWTLQSVLKMDKDTGSGITTVGPNDYLRPNGIYMVSANTLPLGSNICSIENGGCSGLCLPIGFDRNCTCADGFEFDEDGTTCTPDQATECPRVFHNGYVDESCDPRPGQICDVQCHRGFSPRTDAIVCQVSGTWDLDVNTICNRVECDDLDTPPNAIIGPCNPPFTLGKMCTLSCREGYMNIAGSDKIMCGENGEWIGTPIRCQQHARSSVSLRCHVGSSPCILVYQSRLHTLFL
ncbi:low-density lipoprotein receptor-related protein 6-like [Lytechinus pictus]|uniref:low-density lipoprotein receptor-related protein 6-like n=1 Tax=Lytechinus pictus TaxID=7653 RepID=UPI0030B9E5BE